MTAFASKTPRDLNRDPEPWRGNVMGARASNALMEQRRHAEGFTYAPRPEYDPPQNNEPNVILLGIRYLMRDGVHRDLAAYYAEAALYLTGGTHALDRPIQPGMADHARRVLTRLANLAQKES